MKTFMKTNIQLQLLTDTRQNKPISNRLANKGQFAITLQKITEHFLKGMLCSLADSIELIQKRYNQLYLPLETIGSVPVTSV